MATPVLAPPPITTPLAQKDGLPQAWARWFQQLREAVAGQPNWIYPGDAGAPAFEANFSQWGSPLNAAFRKRADGVVEFNAGIVAIGAAVPANNALIFTLPAAYAPAQTIILPSVTRDGTSNDTFASIGISADGTVRLRYLATWYANSFIGLSGSFSTGK